MTAQPDITTWEHLDPNDRQLLKDLSKHALDQCISAIERAQELLPEDLEHLLSLGVIASISAIAVRDVVWAYHQQLPDEKPPTFECMLNAVFTHIKHLAMTSGAPEEVRKAGYAR